MADFDTLLIANRGEIAARIARTAKAEGLRVVMVVSGAERGAFHTRFADHVEEIGDAPLSYLDADAIIAAAERSGAGAVHPGYGFLSENAAFARAVAAAGLVFVGPPANAIETMGDKARAKALMEKAGVPCIPGYDGADQNDEAFGRAAQEIGYPVMIKASAGGGGRGMRLVTREDDLADALATARKEAQSAFGNGHLILEKAIGDARHIEVQVFADTHGNVVHLGERDCSLQRRHQKVIEEAPSPAVDEALRDRLGEAAVAAARAVGYAGAGTVEFLLDGSGDFHFLEMNTRLQVEHPVTEAVTGLDLIAMQLAVARGEALPVAQENVVLSGHAIEARLCAEDVASSFAASAGPVHLFEPGGGVRVDAGIASGGSVSPHYDSMVAKIIAKGATREEARRKLVAALEETVMFGPVTNRGFLIDLLEHETFRQGAATTGMIDAGMVDAMPDLNHRHLALVQHLAARARADGLALSSQEGLFEFRSDGPTARMARFHLNGEAKAVSITPLSATSFDVEGERIDVLEIADDRAVFRDATGQVRHRWYLDTQGALHIAGAHWDAVLEKPDRGVAALAGGNAVTAPMHGAVTSVAVAEGDTVSAGATLATLEAMKMQHSITAPRDGVVAQVSVSPGAQVAAGDVLVVLEADDV